MDIHHKKARDFFEKLYKLYNNKDYIDTDPIRFAHQLEGNKEFIAFTSSCFAYGNMKAIQSFLFKYFDFFSSHLRSNTNFASLTVISLRLTNLPIKNSGFGNFNISNYPFTSFKNRL